MDSGADSSSALIDMVDTICTELNNTNFFGGMFLDLRKAFYSINHDILMAKLKSIGFGEMSSLLLQNYVYGRRQLVVVNTTSSDMLPVLTGVPQGYVLESLLFLIFINDLSELNGILKGKLYLFADNTTLLYSSKSIDELKSNIESEYMN